MKVNFHPALLVLTAIFTLSLLIAGCGHEHDYGDWEIIREASCTKDGIKVRVCNDCDHEITRKIQAIGQHNYTEQVTTEATCITDGVKTFTCSQCSDTYTEAFSCPIYTATELYEKSLCSVGEIITYDQKGNELAIGTGFAYSSDGKIITNYHVIQDAYSAAITINGKRYTVEQVLAYDKNIDIAVLKTSARNLTAVTLCKHNHSVGEVVYAFGSSQGLTATFSEGMITHSERIIEAVRYTQHDAPISSGNSGGPLINKYGEVIGINTWTVQDSQNLNFAIRVTELDKLNFNHPLTMAEFYKKEGNAFIRLKNYIVANGTYSDSDKAYSIVTDESYSANYANKYCSCAYYYPADDTVTLDLLINDGEDWVYFVLDDSLNGTYYWEYFNDYGNEMSGTLYAATYSEDMLLGYNYNNIDDSYLRDSIRELASSMVDYICAYISEDFSAIGVTAKDLGFALYQ